MAIHAFLSNCEVEILDARTDQDGRKFARVHALQGEPFQTYTHGGWATTATTTVRAELLQDVHQTEPQPVHVQPKRVTLLDLARAAAKSQWYSGEASNIWGNAAAGAFLKETGGRVSLFLRKDGKLSRPLNVFFLDPLHGWTEVKGLETQYSIWMQRVKGV